MCFIQYLKAKRLLATFSKNVLMTNSRTNVKEFGIVLLQLSNFYLIFMTPTASGVAFQRNDGEPALYDTRAGQI